MVKTLLPELGFGYPIASFGLAVLLQSWFELHLEFLISESLRQLGEEMHPTAFLVSPMGQRMVTEGKRLWKGAGRL